MNEPGRDYRFLLRDGTFNVSRKGVTAIRATDLYHSLLTISWWRFIALTLISYLSVNVLFASLYLMSGPEALEGIRASDFVGRFEGCFFFSVQTLSTIGFGHVSPHSLLANWVVTFEALVGLLGLAMATGLLFARFSKPTSRVIFSNVALITDHDGVRSLVFRLANKRRNQIVDAEINVALLINEVTAEGERYRNFYDLALERQRSPVFALTWTVVHPIDEKSPLRGLSLEDLRERGAEIFVSLTGIDDSFFQTIHSRFSYVPEEIVWDGAFEDIIARKEGRIQVDLDKIHDLKRRN